MMDIPNKKVTVKWETEDEKGKIERVFSDRNPAVAHRLAQAFVEKIVNMGGLWLDGSTWIPYHRVQRIDLN